MTNRSLPEMPCGPILELHGQRKRFHIPYGLKPLLEDMTREVLRAQPENIFDFLAVFMENRLKRKREEEEQKKARKSWKQHRWSWQGTSVLPPEELQEFLHEFHTPVEEATHHAVVIQSAYRGYLARKKVKEIRKSKQMDGAPKLGGEGAGDQGNRKSWKVHRWSAEGTSLLPPEELNEFIQDLEQEHKTKRDTLEEKAIKIQSAFRGYQARKKVKEIRKSKDLGLPPPTEFSPSPDSGSGSGGTGAPDETRQEDVGSSDPSPPLPTESEGAPRSSTTAATPVTATTEITETGPEQSHVEESEPVPSASEAEPSASAHEQ